MIDQQPPPRPEPDERVPNPPRDIRHAWSRLFRAGSPRPTRSNLLAAALAGVLGFAFVAQVRQTSTEGLETLREDELVRVFAAVDQDGERLTTEINKLESSLALLKSQSTNVAAAEKAAQERLDALGILSGTVAASGPGIKVTILGLDSSTAATILLDTVQELRDAGAEAIQVNGERVIAQTWFGDGGTGVQVSGELITSPYVVSAIGDPNTLAVAMEIPGGVTATVRRAGGEATVSIQERVDVDALLSPATPEYARPVPTPSP